MFIRRILNTFKINQYNQPVIISSYHKKCLSTERSTINTDELRRFEAYQNEWWNPSGPSKGLHMLNNLRVPYVRDELLNAHGVGLSDVNYRRGPNPLKGFKIADIGCGAGIFSEALAKIGADVTGIDASKDLISIAREHAKKSPSLESNLRYVDTTVEDHIKDYRAHYDAIVCSEVIEHVDNKALFVEQCVKLAKSGGSVIFTTVNKTWFAYFAVVIWAENIGRNVPRGTHHYNMFISNKEMEKLFVKNRCQVRSVQGIAAKPNLEFFFINSLQFNYAIHAIKK